MHANLDFAEQVHVVSGFLPADLATAQAGDWISLKNYSKVTVIFFKNVGQSAEDPTLTFQQAKDVSGGTPIDLDVIDKVYVKQAATDLLSTGTFTVVTQTANNTYTEGTSGEQVALWVVDFYADDLDIANGYTSFRATIADTGTNVSNVPYGALLYLLWPPRYGEQALVSAIVD